MLLKSETSLKPEKLLILKRRRITQEFWRSQKSDEIIFVSAPLLFGKTTAVVEAMETLQYRYLHIRFDEFMNNPVHFLSHVISRLKSEAKNSISNDEKAQALLLNELSFQELPENIIIDDFQLCNSVETYNIIKSIYKLACDNTRLIFISRCTPPKEFIDWECANKIKMIKEEVLAFSEAEIKKLSVQNKIWLNKVHIRQLHEQSSGCAGFITEKLSHGWYYTGLCQTSSFLSYISYYISKIFSEENILILSNLKLLNCIPKGLFSDMGKNNDIIRQAVRFSCVTGLIAFSDDTMTLHPLFKLYLNGLKFIEEESYSAICEKLLHYKKYDEALLYAFESESISTIDKVIKAFLECGINITDESLERLVSQSENRNPTDEIEFLLNLHAASRGEKTALKFILDYSKRYSYAGFFIKTHIMTSPYPHESLLVNSDFPSGNTYKLLGVCGKLYCNMKYDEAIAVLNNIAGQCEEEEINPYYMLMIKSLQGLHMYGQAERKLHEYQCRVSNSLPDNKVFEQFQTHYLIMNGDITAAEEWLSSGAKSANKNICYATVQNSLTDVLANLALGEPDLALWELKKVLPFAQRAGLPRLHTESLVMSALAYQQKQNLSQAIEFIEKALCVAEKEKQGATIIEFGVAIAFLVEKSYCRRARKKEGNTFFMKNILSNIKSKKNRLGTVLIYNKGTTLSERQKQMLDLLFEGYTYKQISEETDLKITTVRDHIKKLYEKLEVRNSADAIAKALEKGFL